MVMSMRSFAGQTVVITGASDGIGKAAVRQYALGGARVVMVGRNEAKTRAAAHAIMTDTGRRDIVCEIADLSRQDAVRDLAARLRAAHPVIHVLANNAGAMFLERRLTVDGFEQTFALNHLAYYTLTLLLLPSLYAGAAPGAPARIINVSSRAHENARPALDDLQLSQGFGGWRAYANSKLFNIWFTTSLARRLDPARVVTHAMHPGVVRTRFATNNGRMGRLLRGVMDLVSISPEAGADSLVWLSSAEEATNDSGHYWCRRRKITPSRLARREDLAERLWLRSGALTALDGDVRANEARGHATSTFAAPPTAPAPHGQS
ncbi:SDR family NAD(P)-dependent oxidoreductase [Gemmatimonas sp.]|uniref:SDR family NAD(P)-dependent oxidoreductase n=1 Tax=Gemmatimonas sp. TaxID=1962908 RepID=UPI0025B7C0E0|nr:SDR family NAD(P)-dependent oxidoreductase [Gemmatimonas sp.]MCA2996302.1 SDR family NAD(P)-dependent oxidoreductase [Gemmatimonas sp.]